MKTIVENNRLSTPLEQERIQELVNKGVASKDELKAVACVLHHCSAGFASEEPEKQVYELLEKLGSSPEYSQLRDQLSKEKFTISYTDPSSGLEITQSVSLFEYSKMDGLLDDASYADGKYLLSNRGLGALQAVGGAIEIVGGVVSCSTPLTCVAGAAVAASGYDNLRAGSNTLVTDQQTKTMGAKALEALGVPPEYSEIVYSTTTLGSTGTIVLKSVKTGKTITTTVTAEGKVSRKIGNSGLVTNARKGTTSTGSKTGEYLEGFKPSSTPPELVQQQAGKGSQTAINTEHILNGEIKTYANGTKVGTGGHYLKDPNIKVDQWIGSADANGVTTGYISVRDPVTGKWYKKQAETTFFSEHWSKRQTEMGIKSAFENSKPHSDPLKKEMWQGTSSSGLKIEGYYKKPDGTGATAWPVYQGVKN